MPECVKCDKWYLTAGELVAHNQRKHPKPKVARLSLGSGTQPKKKGQSGRRRKSSPVQPEELECDLCSNKFFPTAMSIHHSIHHYPGWEEDSLSDGSAYLAQTQTTTLSSNNSVASSPLSPIHDTDSFSSMSPPVSEDAARAQDTATPLSTLRARRSAPASLQSKSQAVAAETPTPPKRLKNEKSANASASSVSSSTSSGVSSQANPYNVSPEVFYLRTEELEATIDEFAERQKVVIENEEQRDYWRKEARRNGWVQDRRRRIREEAKDEERKKKLEEEMMKIEEAREEELKKSTERRLARIREVEGEEVFQKYLQDIEDEKKRVEEESKMSKEDRKKLQDERAKKEAKRQEQLRKEMEEEKEKIRKQKKQEEAAAERARALNPDITPIDWISFDRTAFVRDEAGRLATQERLRKSQGNTVPPTMEMISWDILAKMYNSFLSRVEYANIFTVEESKDVKYKLMVYRREMLNDSRFLTCWKAMKTQRKRIERDLLKAHTLAMNDVYADRRPVWNINMRNDTNRNVHYKDTKEAYCNLFITVTSDAKTVIYGVDHDKYGLETNDKEESDELVLEEWSEERRGRSTKGRFAKITTPELPEYYISKYLLELMLENEEWNTWKKLEKKTGEMSIHLPTVIQNDEMDAYAYHRMCWRHLREAQTNCYVWLNEAHKSEVTWDTIKEAIEARIEQP